MSQPSFLPGMPRIMAVRRYFNWNGRQTPMLGIALPGTDPLSRAARREAIRGDWIHLLSLADELGLELVSLAGDLWRDPESVSFLLEECAKRRLACLLEVPPDRSIEDGLAGYAEAHPGLMLHLVLDGAGPGIEEHLELELHPSAARLGVPVLVSMRDVLGPGGRRLRGLGRTADCVAARLDAGDPLDPASLVGTCLAARLPDRPGALLFDGNEAGACGAVLRASTVSGLALCIVAPPPGHAGRKTLEEIAGVLREMPEELPEPVEDEAFVLVLDEARTQPTEAVLASLLLLQRSGGMNTGLLFESHVSEGSRPAFVHVAAHGRLEASTWNRCFGLASRGSEVLITGLCLDGDETPRRLERLRIEARTLEEPELRKPPRWLSGASRLDTGDRILSRTVGLGRLGFLDRCIELEPGEDDSVSRIREALRHAGLEPRPSPDGDHGLGRELRFSVGSLRADLTAGWLRWDEHR